METRASPRTWFCTLTFRPAARERLFMEKNENDVLVMSTETRRHQRAIAEISLWLKRMRAALSASDASAMSVRFFAVTEPHQDGTPHIHVLVHCGDEMKKSVIQAAKWPHGFWSAKLVDADAAKYLTKYLTKEHHRVRASIRYGLGRDQNSGHVTETPEAQSEGKEPRPLGELPTLTGEVVAGAKVDETPVAMLRAMVYNGELSVDDHVSLVTTLVELASEQDEQLQRKRADVRPDRAGTVEPSGVSEGVAEDDRRLREEASARASERVSAKPAPSRSASSDKDSKLRAGPRRKAGPSGSRKA